jgi:hypothetical protein
MAISIPIISSLDTSGFDKAQKEFAALDGAGAKTGFALKKATIRQSSRSNWQRFGQIQHRICDPGIRFSVIQ